MMGVDRLARGLSLSSLVLMLISTAIAVSQASQRADRPNVLIILADDLGYGDVKVYNPDRGKIPTPNIDRLAAEGMRFTDAHTSSGACSPTRYSLLTGRYHWRTRLQSGIVSTFGKPLIAPDRLTLAGLLKRSGYRTACLGKWHLGWDWPIPEGKLPLFFSPPAQSPDLATPEQVALWKQVFSQRIPGGPTTRGFDEYFGTDVPNWPPFCYIEGDRTTGVPTEYLPRPLLKREQASVAGPALPGWRLEQILPTLRDRTVGYLRRAAGRPEPFFLYLALTAPHTPLAVNAQWKGKSGLIPYADLVMETDAAVGDILEALRESGQAEKTLVVFTSDNGCAPYIGVQEMEAKGHFPSGPFRGYKADAWEGGHRVPFIVRWPGVVKPGTTCGQTVTSVDLMRTLAEIVSERLPDSAGEDSVSLMPLLKGSEQPIRSEVVHHANNGIFALRAGNLKLIFGPDGGGYGSPDRPVPPGASPVLLYDMQKDPAETTNLAAAQPAAVERLTRTMERLIRDGRSTPRQAAAERRRGAMAPRRLRAPGVRVVPVAR